jgi:hypothetical protein
VCHKRADCNRQDRNEDPERDLRRVRGQTTSSERRAPWFACCFLTEGGEYVLPSLVMIRAPG